MTRMNLLTKQSHKQKKKKKLQLPKGKGEKGNGYPLQCSCLENPRDRGAWWAAVYGVAQSQTRLKRLSSSSSKGERTILEFGINIYY